MGIPLIEIDQHPLLALYGALYHTPPRYHTIPSQSTYSTSTTVLPPSYTCCYYTLDVGAQRDTRYSGLRG